jgi:hypothetical protein
MKLSPAIDSLQLSVGDGNELRICPSIHLLESYQLPSSAMTKISTPHHSMARATYGSSFERRLRSAKF